MSALLLILMTVASLVFPPVSPVSPQAAPSAQPIAYLPTIAVNAQLPQVLPDGVTRIAYHSPFWTPAH